MEDSTAQRHLLGGVIKPLIWGRSLAFTVPVPGLQGYVPGAEKRNGFGIGLPKE